MTAASTMPQPPRTSSASDRSWRPGPLRRGTDPDPRFTLANERTFLAWIRTALGIIAAALALETLSGQHFLESTRRLLVCVLLVFAVLITAAAGFRWFRIEIAMRTNQSLPLPGIVILTAIFVVGCALAIAVLTLQ